VPESLGILATSDYTLVVKLERPAPYFPQLLTHGSTYPIYSVASARSHDASTWIGNGPYVLMSWSRGNAIRITQNRYYWDRANVHINSVQFIVVPDENAQYAQYRAGEIDLTDTVPPNVVGAHRQALGSELVIFPFLATAYYGLNMTAPPFASNIKLRQALAMAIDRKQLTDILAFGQVGAFGLVPPGTWNYTPQAWAWKSLNNRERIAMAQQLYAEAGYSDKSPLRLRVIYNTKFLYSKHSNRDRLHVEGGAWN
jgi:oligopeptide transport system substrate-binding protein